MKSFPRAVLGAVAAGTLLRVVLAVVFQHRSFDLDSQRIVIGSLTSAWTEVYETLRWPYPPGYFPVLLGADVMSRALDIPYAVCSQLTPIAADGALALVVYRYLAQRRDARTATLGAALVALGPVFVVVSGYTVQLDAVAILPAAIAFLVWDSPEHRDRRWLYVGLLLGIGGLVKTVPAVLVLAFLPTAVDLKERARMTATAVAVVVIGLAPWLLTEPRDVYDALTYGGVPGFGGPTLVLQPEVPANAISPHRDVAFSQLNQRLSDAALPIVLIAMAAVSVVLVRRRSDPVRSASALWLTFYAVTPNFFFQYLVWGLPAFLMSGAVLAVAVAQVLLVVPQVLFESAPWEKEWLGDLYVAVMLAAWVAAWFALVRVLRRP